MTFALQSSSVTGETFMLMQNIASVYEVLDL